MKKLHYNGYQTCIHSLKRENAPWRVASSCENRARLSIGRHYELPNYTLCVACPFYCEDKRLAKRKK